MQKKKEYSFDFKRNTKSACFLSLKKQHKYTYQVFLL